MDALRPVDTLCGQSSGRATDTELLSWLGRLAVGRLEDKAMVIAQRLEMNRGDWDETPGSLLPVHWEILSMLSPWSR